MSCPECKLLDIRPRRLSTVSHVFRLTRVHASITVTFCCTCQHHSMWMEAGGGDCTGSTPLIQKARAGNRLDIRQSGAVQVEEFYLMALGTTGKLAI